MTTNNYQRSPLRSLYNYNDALAAAGRGNSSRLRSQLRPVQTRQRQSSSIPGLTDQERSNIEKGAVKGGLKYASGYSLGTGTAGNSAAAQNGYGSLDHANYNDVSSTIDDAGGAEATNPDSGSGGGGESSSSGSYLGGATGAYAGYRMGDYNNETDPDMYSHEDGYGRYNTTGFNKNYNGSYDNRAAWGGGTLGGVIGYFSNGYATPLVTPVVRWFHPYAQDMTRSVINAGDALGGAGGAMLLDPIGTLASGKYSSRDIAESGLEAGASGGLSLLSHSSALENIGDKIEDIFGW